MIRTSTREAELAKLLHQHLALHEVRHRQPVLHDRRPGRRGLQQRPRARSATTTRVPPTCPGPGFAAGPCLFKDTMQLAAFTATTSRWARRRCRSTRACPPTSSSALERRARALRGKTRRHPRHGVQGRVGRHPRIAELQAAQAAGSGRARRSCAPTRTSRDPRLVPLDEVLAQSDMLVVGAPHRHTRASTLGGRDVVDVWGVFGAAASTCEGPRHRRSRLHLRLPGRRAPRSRPRGRRGRQLQQVRRARQELRPTPALPLRRGRRQGRDRSCATSRPTATRSSPPPR